MRILGIETSCDETSAAVVENGTQILSNVISSSLKLHAKTGGIIPEIAARQQSKYMIPVIKEAINLRGGEQKTINSIDAIAVTIGPGLIGSLLVGIETAKTLAYIWNKPIIPVNHLIGHIYANFVSSDQTLSLRAKRSNLDQQKIASSPAKPDPRNDKLIFPAIVSIVSGGHTDLLLMKNHQQLKWLGGTRDDAAGEAFDKIGRLLGLPYPGGPNIEQRAKKGNPKAYNFPRPMIGSNDYDFSFSGLKTAILREVQYHNVILKPKAEESQKRSFVNTQDDIFIADISASVQQSIVDVLIKKTLKAAEKFKVKSILLSGGVSANNRLREQFELEIRNLKFEIPFFAPEKWLCTDNAAMIASAAFFHFKPQRLEEINVNPDLYFQ